jgi:hypothetical protein
MYPALFQAESQHLQYFQVLRVRSRLPLKYQMESNLEPRRRLAIYLARLTRPRQYIPAPVVKPHHRHSNQAFRCPDYPRYAPLFRFQA